MANNPRSIHSLSGCYLLIVVGEPSNNEHRDVMLQKISKGFLSWDLEGTGCCISAELQYLVDQDPQPEEAKNGEKLIQFVSENLVTEVLINPQLNTLQQCMKNLMNSYTKHKHVIHAGYSFTGSGSWILQDSTYSFADFLQAFNDHEVQRLFKIYESSISIHLHCASEGEWTTARLNQEASAKLVTAAVNPNDKCSNLNGISNFVNFLARYIVAQPLEKILEPSEVVGNIRFSRPTLYIFPGGQGDSALFGVNGFNMLIDGGFNRKACFWDFARHLDRVDAVLVTRINNSNVNGVSSFFKRKAMGEVYPRIGHVFCNILDRKHSPDGDKDSDSLLVSLAEEGHLMMDNLRHLGLKPQNCFREASVDAINLYHKVGHGNLDMYVLNPAKDSREVKEFLQQWHSQSSAFGSSRMGVKVGNKELLFPLPNLMSICAILVWQPADSSDSITRILFPGSSPQNKIFEGLEKLRYLNVLKAPVCSEKSLKVISTKHKPKSQYGDHKATRQGGKLEKISAEDEITPIPKYQPPVIPLVKSISDKEAKIKHDGKTLSKIHEEKKSEFLKAVKADDKKMEVKAATTTILQSSEKPDVKKHDIKKIQNVEKKLEKKKPAQISNKESQQAKSNIAKTSRSFTPSSVTSSEILASNKNVSKPKGLKEATNKKAAEEKNKAALAAKKSIAKKTTIESTPKPIKKIKQPEAVAPVQPIVVKEDNNAAVLSSIDEQAQQDSAEEEKVSVDEKQSLDEEVQGEKESIRRIEEIMMESSHTATTTTTDEDDDTVISSRVGNQLFDSIEQEAEDEPAPTVEEPETKATVDAAETPIVGEKVEEYEDHYDDRLQKLETILKQYKDISSSISRLPDFNNKGEVDADKPEEVTPTYDDSHRRGSHEIQKMIEEKLSVVDDVLKTSPSSESIKLSPKTEQFLETEVKEETKVDVNHPLIENSHKTPEITITEEQKSTVADKDDDDYLEDEQLSSLEKEKMEELMKDERPLSPLPDVDQPVNIINLPEEHPENEEKASKLDKQVELPKEVLQKEHFVGDELEEIGIKKTEHAEFHVESSEKPKLDDNALEIKKFEKSSGEVKTTPLTHSPPHSPVAKDLKNLLVTTKEAPERDIRSASPNAILSPIPEDAPKILKMVEITNLSKESGEQEKGLETAAIQKVIAAAPAPVEFLRTPDEVADLPIHEEVPTEFDGYYHFARKPYPEQLETFVEPTLDAKVNTKVAEGHQPAPSFGAHPAAAAADAAATHAPENADDEENEEELIIVSRLNADHAETVHISNETSPSTTPHSPRSPKDKDAKEEHNGFVKATTSSLAIKTDTPEIEVPILESALIQYQNEQEMKFDEKMKAEEKSLQSKESEKLTMKVEDIKPDRPEFELPTKTIDEKQQVGVEAEKDVQTKPLLTEEKLPVEKEPKVEDEQKSFAKLQQYEEQSKEISFGKKELESTPTNKTEETVLKTDKYDETVGKSEDVIKFEKQELTPAKAEGSLIEIKSDIPKKEFVESLKVEDLETQESKNKEIMSEIKVEMSADNIFQESSSPLLSHQFEESKKCIETEIAVTQIQPEKVQKIEIDLNEKLEHTKLQTEDEAMLKSTIEKEQKLESDKFEKSETVGTCYKEATPQPHGAEPQTHEIVEQMKNIISTEHQVKDAPQTKSVIDDTSSDLLITSDKASEIEAKQASTTFEKELVGFQAKEDAEYQKPYIEKVSEIEAKQSSTTSEKEFGGFHTKDDTVFQRPYVEDEKNVEEKIEKEMHHETKSEKTSNASVTAAESSEPRQIICQAKADAEFEDDNIKHAEITLKSDKIPDSGDLILATQLSRPIALAETEIVHENNFKSEEQKEKIGLDKVQPDMESLKELQKPENKFETVVEKSKEASKSEETMELMKSDLKVDEAAISTSPLTSKIDVVQHEVASMSPSPPYPHYEEPWSSLHSQMMKEQENEHIWDDVDSKEPFNQTDSHGKWSSGADKPITDGHEIQESALELDKPSTNPFDIDPMTQSFYDFTTSTSSSRQAHEEASSFHDEKAIDDFASTHTKNELKQPDVVESKIISELKTSAVSSSSSPSPDIFPHDKPGYVEEDKEYDGYYEVHHPPESDAEALISQPIIPPPVSAKDDLYQIYHTQDAAGDESQIAHSLSQKEACSYDEKDHEDVEESHLLYGDKDTKIYTQTKTLPMYTKTYLAEDDDDHLQIAKGRERAETFIEDDSSETLPISIRKISPMEQSYHSDYDQPNLFSYQDEQKLSEDPMYVQQIPLSQESDEPHFPPGHEIQLCQNVPDVTTHSPMYISADDDTEEEYKAPDRYQDNLQSSDVEFDSPYHKPVLTTAMPQFVKSYPRPDNVASDDSDLEIGQHGHELTSHHGGHQLHRVLPGGRGAQSEQWDLYDKEANNLEQQEQNDNESYITKESYLEESESRDAQGEERYSPICTPEYGGSPSYARERSTTSTETDVEEEEEEEDENEDEQPHNKEAFSFGRHSDKGSPEFERKPLTFAAKEMHRRGVEGTDSPYPTSTGSGAVSLSSPGDDLSSSASIQDDKKSGPKPVSRNPFEEWGEPMGLPSPPPLDSVDKSSKAKVEGKVLKKSSKNEVGGDVADNKELKKNGTTDNGGEKHAWKKFQQTSSPKRTPMPPSKSSPIKTKRPESPLSASDVPHRRSTNSGGNKNHMSPIYVDLTYIPHHGNPFYADVEFFRTVRARYYVFSGTNPSKEVFNALLEAKQSWEDPDLEVTIIPTYDTDTLGYWFAVNEELLNKHKIDLAPSASRCTINLQDHETSCSAYRLEF